jgi:hypothetical protein
MWCSGFWLVSSGVSTLSCALSPPQLIIAHVRGDTMTVHWKYLLVDAFREIVFTVRIIHNIQTQPVGSMQHFLMLQPVVHIVTTGPYMFNIDNYICCLKSLLFWHLLFPIYTIFINIKDVRYQHNIFWKQRQFLIFTEQFRRILFRL